ncbi:MAG: molybdopterin molybdotransferase MoeA [Atopobiaceae bacterium]
MRDHSSHIELSREDAIAALLGHAQWTRRSELVGLHQAFGRVTASDCVSRVDVPNALCSVMDGIAVRYDDFAQGIPDTSQWQVGVDFGWANTGCAMPEGFDTAIPIEQVRFSNAPSLGEKDPGSLTILEAPNQRGASCRVPGAEYRAGQVIVPARTRLTPTKVAALAMCGISEVEVLVRPRVGFIPTGTELVPAGSALPRGKAYECNGVLLEGKLPLWGAEPVVMGCAPDEPEAIRQALSLACSTCDVAVICGGSSKGEHDYTMEVLESLGQVLCHETNHGPGKHTSAAVVDGTPVLGLSGPPGGFEITADWYLKPLVDAYLYGHQRPFRKVTARLVAPEHAGVPNGKGARAGFRGFGKPAQNFFVIRPVKVESVDGKLVATPVTGGPHPDLVKLDEATGYLEAHPRAIHQMKPGDEVQIELRYPYTEL